MLLNKLIRELDKRRGERTWAMLAAEIGISAAYLCDVRRGHRKPGRKILDYLGFEVQTVYVKQAEPEKVSQ